MQCTYNYNYAFSTKKLPNTSINTPESSKLRYFCHHFGNCAKTDLRYWQIALNTYTLLQTKHHRYWLSWGAFGEEAPPFSQPDNVAMTFKSIIYKLIQHSFE